MYGRHILIDAYGCDPAALADRDSIEAWLNTLPAKIGMEILQPAEPIQYNNPNNSRESGVTGVVVITTSHASIHTYPYMESTRPDLDKDGGMAFFDCFSCKDFDPVVVVKEFEMMFKPTRIDFGEIFRGKDFPNLEDRK